MFDSDITNNLITSRGTKFKINGKQKKPATITYGGNIDLRKSI